MSTATSDRLPVRSVRPRRRSLEEAIDEPRSDVPASDDPPPSPGRRRLTLGLLVVSLGLLVAARLLLPARGDPPPAFLVCGLLGLLGLGAAATIGLLGRVIDRGAVEPVAMTPRQRAAAEGFHRFALLGRRAAFWLAVAGAAITALVSLAATKGMEATKLWVVVLGPALLAYGLAGLVEPRLLTRCWDPDDLRVNGFHALTGLVLVAGGLLGFVGHVALVAGR
jgi:hypothetical protein